MIDLQLAAIRLSKALDYCAKRKINLSSCNEEINLISEIYLAHRNEKSHKYNQNLHHHLLEASACSLMNFESFEERKSKLLDKNKWP